MILLALLVASIDVRYVVRVEERPWQPMAKTDVEALLEQKVLPTLTESGAMTLKKSGFADLKQGDYSLLIEGRFIEEAEELSVYVTWSPGSKTELPSFYASDSAPIGRRPIVAMQKVIEDLSRSVATKLRGVLSPYLDVTAPANDKPVSLPFTWGDIAIPKVERSSQQVQRLLDLRGADSARLGAIAELAPHAFDQPVVEKAALRCMLTDPSPEVRAACVRALAPVVRNRVPSQRLVLLALRREYHPEVVRALSALAQNFVGLSRKEAIATYLELVASEATTGETASQVTELLAREGDVPNLDVATRKCLEQRALVYGKRSACADQLLRVIPPARRPKVVWNYVKNVEVHEQGEANVFDEVMRDVAPYSSEPLPRAFAELLLDVCLRPSASQARLTALSSLVRYPHPSAEVFNRLMPLAADPQIGWIAIRTIEEMVGKEPTQKEAVVRGFKNLLATQPLFHRVSRPDMRQEITETLKRLEKS